MVMLLEDEVLPIVLPVVPPIFTGQVVEVPEILIPVKVDATLLFMAISCIVFPCIELEVLFNVPVVFRLIPMNGVAAVVVMPSITLLLMAEPFVVLFNVIGVIAPVLANCMLPAVLLPIVLPVVVPIFTKLAAVAAIPVKVVVTVPVRVIPTIVLP